jgi:hypothetical protein
MANNVPVTAGAGTTIATDDVAGVHYQVVKLSAGNEDVADRIGGDATFGLDVDVTRMPSVSLAASEVHIGQIGSHSSVIRPTITISTSPYAAGDVIGGKLTLTNAMRVSSGTGWLNSISIVDTDNEKAEITFLFFNADFTSPADNAAWSWNSADFGKVLGHVVMGGTDAPYLTIGGEAVCTRTGIGLALAANGTANIYTVGVLTAAPTYGATTDLRVAFGIIQD